MPIINKNFIPKIELGEDGKPLRCPLFTDQQWDKFIKRGEKICRYGWTWREILDMKLILLPPVKVRNGKRSRAGCITKHDVYQVIERYKQLGNDQPYTTAIANELGVSDDTIHMLNRKYWHMELPHSRKRKKNES